MKNVSIPVSWAFAAIVVGLPIFGCIVNSAYGVEGIAISCKIYGFIHVTTAIGFVVIALLGGQALVSFMRTFGMIYLLVALFGFLGMNLQIGYQWLDVISINALNYIEFGLGISFFVVATNLYKRQCLVSNIT